MTIKANEHQKHAALKRPALGDFGRNEFGVLGAPCGVIRSLAEKWIAQLSAKYKIAYVDADHQADETLIPAGALVYTDKISFKRIDLKAESTPFANRALFNEQDLVLINGNHFNAKQQIAIIHPEKPLEKKLEKLTDVQLILLSPGSVVPDYLGSLAVPVVSLDDEAAISDFLDSWMHRRIAPLKGLVLAGGKSERMHTDKGSIAYHGKTQREHMFGMLADLCTETFISGRSEEGLPEIPDSFTGLGPYGGILSAMQKDPDASWLTVACDLPYLTVDTLQHLVQQRNPSKIATAFLDSDARFPEPLITIWEPRAYPVLLQFLSQGYSCPRKVLINTDIELLQAPDVAEFRNVNFPEERDEAMRYFNNPSS